MKKKIIIGSIVICLVLATTAVFVIAKRQPSAVEYSSVKVEQQDLQQTVSETGTVVANTELQYGWEISGRVVRIDKQVGETVVQEETIATIDATQQQARLREAQSALAAAQAALQLKIAGPSEAQKVQGEASVVQAQAALDQAQVELQKVTISSQSAIRSAELALSDAQAALEHIGSSSAQSIQNAYENALQEANSAVAVALSAVAIVSNIQHTYAQLIDGSAVSLNLASKKAVAVEALVGVPNAGKWRTENIVNIHGGVRGNIEIMLTQSTYDPARIDQIIIDTESMLQKVKSMLDEMVVGLNTVNESTATEQSNVNSSRTSVNAELTGIVNAKQAIVNAKLSGESGGDANYFAYEKAKQALENAKQDATQNIAGAEVAVRIKQAALQQSQAAYDVLVVPPRDVDVASLRADVARVQATLSQYQQEVDKTILKALMDGVVSVLDTKVGETVVANQSVVTIISPSLSIEVDISESDVAKVQVNNSVFVTLDAFGDDVVLRGEVIRIDPAQTEISGVVYYKTDISFDIPNNIDIRPGMTANVDILTNSIDNALVIPQRAILEKDGKKIVRILIDQRGTYEERVVETGIRGDDGLVQITSGLMHNEEVITFIKENP